MSEYWKSTPKFWCKHCKTFVRDTKFEKQNHEATPKHQGNLQRFVRGLHKDNEREQREKQRAKDEVNRLNGIPPESGRSNAPTQGKKTAVSGSRNDSKAVAPHERRRQLAQLAEMGVAVPEDFRREMAMAGDWQTITTTPVFGTSDATKEERKDDAKSGGLVVGVRKRKIENQDREEDEPKTAKSRTKWGSTTRSYPSAELEEDDSLDALLSSTKTIKDVSGDSEDAKDIVGSIPGVKKESSPDVREADEPNIKQEITQEPFKLEQRSVSSPTTESMPKQEDENEGSAVVFKRRKSKPAHQKV